MKHIYAVILGVITVLFILFSLFYQKQSDGTDMPLKQVEQLMQERPDSAWKLLQHIPQVSKFDEESQAFYALLFTQAQYKNHIPVENDSLLRIAERYYQDSPDSLYKAWTYFYLAQYCRDSGEKEKALSYFQLADRASRNISNDRLRFLLNLHWGSFLIDETDTEDGIGKYRVAKEYVIRLKDTLALVNLYDNWGWGYLLNGKYEQADSMLNLGLKLSLMIENRYYDAYLLNHLSLAARLRGEYFLALRLLDRSIGIFQQDSTELYPLWINKGEIYLNMAQYDSARFYFEKDPRYTTLYEKAGHHRLWGMYEEKMKNYAGALEHSKRYAALLDSIHEEELSFKLTELQRKYDYSLVQSENKLLKVKRQRLYVVLFSICTVVMIVGMVSFFTHREEKRIMSEQIRSKDDLMKQIRLQLQKETIALQSAREEMVSRELNLATELSEREKVIKEYLSNEQSMRKEVLRHSEVIKKMEVLNEMSQRDKNRNSDSIMLSADELANLVEVVNLCYHHFAERLWKQFPALTETDIHLCCLIKIGISNAEILYLLNTNKAALKKRKNRMKHEKMGMGENDSFDGFILNF